MLFHLSICRDPSLPSINTCTVNVKQPSPLQSSLLGACKWKACSALLPFTLLPTAHARFQRGGLWAAGSWCRRWCWSVAWFAQERAVTRRHNGHVCPAAGPSAVAGPGPRAWPPGVTYSRETPGDVSTSHVEGNEGTRGSVRPFPVFFQAVVMTCKRHSLSPLSPESVSKGISPE